MRLERSDSAQSTWQLDLASHLPLEPTIPDQRRIRHLSAVLVHNLTLDPRRDHLSAALFGGHSHSLPAPLVDPLPTSGPSSARHPAATAPTWLPSTSTSQDQGSNPLVRGADSATGSRVLPHPSALNDPPTRDEPSPLPARVRPRRSSSTGTLLARPSPAAPRIDEEPAPSPLPAPPDPAGPSSSRARSASRASVASAGSSSTVRQAPRVPPPAPHRPSERERDRPASAAQFAQRERQRREEALRRRLVDCFVSLELVPVPVTVPVAREGGSAPARDGQEEVPGGRRRSGSVASALMQRSGSAGSSHGGGPGAGGLSAPRRGMRRRMTASSLLLTSASASLPASASAAAAAQTPPFFVSPPSRASTHATFPINPAHFLLPREADTDTDTDEAAQGGPALPGDPATASWPGLREGRVRARVFGRPSEVLLGKGKGRARGDEDEDGRDGGWRLLAEWDVELGGLTSLGRDPTLFPSLPPNTLIFALSPSSPSFCTASQSSSSSPSASSAAAPSDTEYFTAPLPLLRRAARASAPRRARAGAGAPLAGTGAMRSLSEDEASPGGSSCDDSDAAAEDAGNLSDPGVGPGASGRVRARTRTRTRTRSRGASVSLAAAAAAKRDDLRLRRQAVVERSRRETRMAVPCRPQAARRLWEGEREGEELWREGEEGRRRVGEVLGREGEGGWAELERERAEYQDRVDDLEAVREAVELELADEVAALEARREALRARRERLEQAKELDVANRARAEVQRAELDERDAALAQVGDTSRTRRTQLITLLSHIFPIEPVSSPPPASPPLLFSIVGLPLPNSSYPPSYTDDTLSSALGYAAHVTHLVAAYLGVPLCYPLRCRASRSVVVDDISMMKGPRAFPLYARGVDRYRFDYGVFLLNKNIEQLMYSQGLTVLDLRNTLPNLKTLILSLSYDPSHADYLSATLRPSAVFSGSGEAATEGEDAPAGDEAPPASTTTTTTTTTTGKGGRSRSSSQASTIRPASRAGSSSRTSSRSSSRRGSSGAVGGAEEEEEEAAARPGSPVAPSPEPAAGLAPNAPPRPNGHANGGPTPASSRHEPTRAEKRTVPAAPTEPGAVSSLGAATGTALKVRVVKSAGGAATTGGAGGGGYAARIRDGLWSAVAGNVAAAAGGGGAGVRGREGAGAGGAEGR